MSDAWSDALEGVPDYDNAPLTAGEFRQLLVRLDDYRQLLIKARDDWRRDAEEEPDRVLVRLWQARAQSYDNALRWLGDVAGGDTHD